MFAEPEFKVIPSAQADELERDPLESVAMVITPSELPSASKVMVPGVLLGESLMSSAKREIVPAAEPSPLSLFKSPLSVRVPSIRVEESVPTKILPEAAVVTP